MRARRSCNCTETVRIPRARTSREIGLKFAEENDWKKMHKESDFKHIEMPCKIVDFFDHNDPHGKVPLSMAEDLIIMEYKYHMKWWSENLDVDKWTGNRHLMEYM